MESIINTFHIDLKIIIAQIVNFGIVFAVLYLYALKPLNKLMKERSEKIEKGVKDAKENASILENSKTKYEEALAQARQEADKIFQAGKKEAETKRILMLEKAKEEVAGMVESGKKSLESERVKMVAEARKEITALSAKMAEKILGGAIGKDFEKKTMKELDNI